MRYHETHYSSNLMTLVLVGNHTLEDLQNMAVENFADIVNKNLLLHDYTKGDPLYDHNTLGHLIKIVPIKDLRLLTISWPQLPEARIMWDSNPMNYISRCMGHEGKNSLLSQLIKDDLATALNAGSISRCQQNFSRFEIAVTLTEKGVANINEVIRMCFAYINMMKQGDGPPEYVHEEKKNMSNIGFNFLQRSSAMITAQSKAQSLGLWHLRPDEVLNEAAVDQILFKPYANTIFRKEAIQQYLDTLRPQDCFITHQSKVYAEEEDLQTEPIYSTQYKKVKISDEQIQDLETALPRPG